MNGPEVTFTIPGIPSRTESNIYRREIFVQKLGIDSDVYGSRFYMVKADKRPGLDAERRHHLTFQRMMKWGHKCHIIKKLANVRTECILPSKLSQSYLTRILQIPTNLEMIIPDLRCTDARGISRVHVRQYLKPADRAAGKNTTPLPQLSNNADHPQPRPVAS